MDKKKIILGALTGVAIFIWVRGLMTHSARRSQPGIVSKEDTASSLPALQKRQKSRTSHTRWGRDPFLLTRTPTTLSLGLRLSGVIFDEQGGYAVINDQICRIGDEINGNKIVDIKQDRVILNDGSKDIELRLEH